jgi:hypothetical protein
MKNVNLRNRSRPILLVFINICGQAIYGNVYVEDPNDGVSSDVSMTPAMAAKKLTTRSLFHQLWTGAAAFLYKLQAS